MFVFEEKVCGKIPHGDVKESQNEPSKNVNRNGSTDTSSINGLLCFCMFQIGSKLRTSLLLLQFPSVTGYINTQNIKWSNLQPSLIALHGTYHSPSKAVVDNGKSEVKPLLSSWLVLYFYKMWNLRIGSQELALSLVIAFLFFFF